MGKADNEGSKPVSAIVTGYEQLCRPGKLPDLVSFVAAAPALDPRDLAALVHIDQRHRHAAGAPLPAEEYFASFPVLRTNVELALDVVYQEYALRREAGEAYSTDKYLARFPDLAERLAMQIELDAALGDVRSSPSLGDPKATTEQSAAYAAGTILAGRYQLLEEIGEGGMGTVWVAQQTEPVRRRVAVKLIKPGMDSRQVLSRFEAERQALALMDHPHIAKVLDGGATEQGRPFFVMEYVKGEPITDYCDRARLSVQERLKLFVQVCQAVQHAHQKGIIHRDLKPSNILVCPFDGHPVPKVIDFGLAKAMNQGLTEQSLYTAHGVMVGTPLYMSPEQAETNNLDIDTRSDVYSLGVILYELLTGSTPLEKQRFHEAAWQEMLRLIKEEEPPKPSTRLSGSGSLPTIAAQRNLEPAQLSRAVRGDLDWIVMKSLEKERSRRYETANGLARDIERYLHDDPVEAHPPSRGYRFRKFARRNKAALLTFAIVTVALVAGTAVSTWQAIRATRAEGLAEERLETEQVARQEADRATVMADKALTAEAEQRELAEVKQAEAEANYQKARETVEKYLTLVSETKLLNVPGLQPLRKELLEAAGEFYKGATLKRDTDPATLADMAAAQLRLFQIYLAVDQIDDGIAAIRGALDIVERLRRDPAAAEHLPKAAGFFSGIRGWQITNKAPSNPLVAAQTMYKLEATWSELSECFPSEPKFQRDLIAVRGLMANALRDSQKAESLKFARKSLAGAEKLVREFPAMREYREDLALAACLLAQYLGELSDEGNGLTHRAIEISEGLLAEVPDSPVYRALVARCVMSFGSGTMWSRPKEAEPFLNRAVELNGDLVREFPDDSGLRDAWADSIVRWAKCPSVDVDGSIARERIQQAVSEMEMLLKSRPKDRFLRQQLASLWHNLTDKALRGSGDPTSREPMEKRALALYLQLYEEYPERTYLLEQAGWCQRNLGEIARRANRLDDARDEYQGAAATFAKLAANKNIPQRDGWYRDREADSLMQLAHVLEDGGRMSDAQLAFRRATEGAQELALQFPNNKQYWTTWTNFTAVEEWFKAKNKLESTEIMRQRVESYEAQVKERPEDRMARTRLAFVCHHLASRLLYSDNDAAGADPLARRASGLWRELADQFPGEWIYLESYGFMCQCIGGIEQRANRPDESSQAYRLAAGAFAKLAANNAISQRDGWYRNWQADSLIQLAQMLAAAKHADDALVAAREGVEIREALAREFPSNQEYRERLTSAQRALADIGGK